MGGNKKMKTWEKTTMEWDPTTEWTTNIPVTDLKGCGNHFVKHMKAVSVSDERRAVLTFDVARGCIGPTTERGLIVETLKKLKKESESRYVNVFEEGIGTEFKITFSLRHQFCDDVLEFVRDFFAILGIEDTRDWRLSDFTIDHETLYAQGAGWIPFTHYFKLRHRLHIDDELAVELMPSLSSLR